MGRVPFAFGRSPDQKPLKKRCEIVSEGRGHNDGPASRPDVTLGAFWAHWPPFRSSPHRPSALLGATAPLVRGQGPVPHGNLADRQKQRGVGMFHVKHLFVKSRKRFIRERSSRHTSRTENSPLRKRGRTRPNIRNEAFPPFGRRVPPRLSSRIKC